MAFSSDPVVVEEDGANLQQREMAAVLATVISPMGLCPTKVGEVGADCRSELPSPPPDPRAARVGGSNLCVQRSGPPPAQPHSAGQIASRVGRGVGNLAWQGLIVSQDGGVGG